MASLLIVYASSEGQTASVADRLATVASEAGLEVTTYEIDDAPRNLDPRTFDGVLVGASIHMGKHQKRARQFVERHSDALGAVPSGFFQVSLSSASDDPERQRDAAGYVTDLVEATGWQPDRVGTFAGALKFGEYGWLKGKIMTAMAADFGAEETDRDHVFTDWDAVTAFGEDFVSLVREADRTTPT